MSRRAELAERLRERWGEIEQGIQTRINAIADSSSTADPSYVEGLRGAVAAALDYGIAAVEQDEGTVWAWLGARRRPDPSLAVSTAAASLPPGLTLAIGEPGEGLAGWRLTHRQAVAALPLAQRGDEPVVRYADVALLASAMREELLAASLRRLYLEPLERDRDGETLRQTLRAYFATGCNVSSTAARLRVDRRTVSKRLRTVEDRIGRPLTTCEVDLQLVLRLEEAPEPVVSAQVVVNRRSSSPH